MSSSLNFLSSFGISIDYIIYGLASALILMFLLVIILFVNQSKLKKKYLQFMDGQDGVSLEEAISTKINEISDLRENGIRNDKSIEQIQNILRITFKKYGIVKYDAFQEMGGKLSFSLAILNDNNDGFIINAMHSNREGCFTYLKVVTKGESNVTLSDSEKEALDIALKY